MPRSKRPWWAGDLARRTKNDKPIPPEGVEEVVIQAQGRRIHVAFIVGPWLRSIVWTRAGWKAGRVWTTHDRAVDLLSALKMPANSPGFVVLPTYDHRAPLTIKGLDEDMERELNALRAKLVLPWWGLALSEFLTIGDDGRVSLPGLVEAVVEGERVAYLLGEPRRKLDYAIKGGAVDDTGKRFYSSHGSMGADLDPVTYITAELKKVPAARGGRAARPWETDVDGLAP